MTLSQRSPLSLFFLILVAAAQLQAAELSPAIFNPSDDWELATDIGLDADSGELTPQQHPEGDIFYTKGEASDGNGYLRTGATYADQIISFEYMVPPESEAAVYVQGRYEIRLSSHGEQTPSASTSGALQAGFDTERDFAFDAQAPLLDAAKPAGEWNTVEIRFRPHRKDEAFNKVANAFFLDISINGEVVQKEVQIPYYNSGSIQHWEQYDGPLVFRAANGPIAIQNARIDHANFEEVLVPSDEESSNISELVDQVELGKETFTALGCIECHTTKKGDTSFKTGPNLYGLFQRYPRKREIVEPATGAHFSIDADRSYAKRSIRLPAAELAIAESGANAGEPYLPVMVTYTEEILSNAKVDAIYRYLATLNDPETRDAVQVLVPKDGPTEYDPTADPMEVLVLDRTRIQRGTMEGLSGRSIHVGLPNGVNYTFDPRTLAIEKLWQGGFVNGAGEWENRGGGGFSPGFASKEIDFAGQGGLLTPLDSEGSPIDFSFKEAVFRDWETIDASLHSSEDHLEMLAKIDAKFLGYSLDSTQPDAAPFFKYRIGPNTLAVQANINSDGTATFLLSGKLVQEQAFSINANALGEITVDSGTLGEDGRWILPATANLQASLTAKIGLASLVWRPEPVEENHLVQPLVVKETEADLPAGYRSEQYVQPVDNYGRDLLFEATAIDVAPDGTIVVGTRTAGIWRIVDGQWRLFAEGLFDCLGLVVEDEKGLTIVAGQKPELTRISDTDGDGIADSFETLADQFSYHGNYHSYMHGPVRDADGNYYFNLNLLHTDDAIYKGQGAYMGTSGGFSGWTIKVTPEGEFIPWANGLRSPASLGIDPEGTIWYADNQGEFVSTSKLFILQEGKFYGHPAGLIDLPNMTPDSAEIQWSAVAEGREKAVALFPHNRVANSPGHMAWDTTGGAFGPFAGQIFIGDQTQSKLLRVATYEVGGQLRAAVIPFGSELQSGLMRPVFLPDGSLLIGQTGRGWHAQGGKIASLQRLVWDGETIAQGILSASLDEAETTLKIELTQPLEKSLTEEILLSETQLESWYYRDAPDYGSPELDLIEHSFAAATISEDRKTITFKIEPSEFEPHEHKTSRVYHLELALPEQLEAYVTGL
ncbi:family 16 glycoside hydrolase [Pelagicoccus albus]|uniref:DUF1080 domain-containing protein n=1 Tax=Pelagicoccus albus TaxID=415222 RepID=A0A7X1B6W0_9BACT|nr:family 16 glycoside hydrolase [Pelagicoccus albus]MBC2606779.1 DUF1080 domain-containing protein [Pelagicoccus albus]